MKLPLRKGMTGPDVLQLQNMLILLAYAISADGMFGSGTESAVVNFQRRSNLVADGIVGQLTYDALVRACNGQSGTPPPPQFITMYPLNVGQFVAEDSTKIGGCFHHTVSDGNPYTVIDVWNNDDRGGVGTAFVVGREMVNSDRTYDGKVLQCFDLKKWAHHIKTDRMGFSWGHNVLANKSYFGIELCSWGALKKVGNDFFDLTGKVKIPDYQVCVLDKEFRTYKYWHRYTDEQLQSLICIFQYASKELNIDFTDKQRDPTNVDAQWFEMDYNAMQAGFYPSIARKVTTHTNFEFGKFDCFPQPELLEAIKQIYKIKP